MFLEFFDSLNLQSYLLITTAYIKRSLKIEAFQDLLYYCLPFQTVYQTPYTNVISQSNFQFLTTNDPSYGIPICEMPPKYTIYLWKISFVVELKL